MSSKKVEARKLKGFQDYEPEITQKRLYIINGVREIAKKAMFHEIATPALEYAEVLFGVGGETEKQIFRFQDNGGRDVAMRFDLTVPFARYVAERNGALTLPFKRMQVGEVWRAEKPQKGRFREFSQCDLDIVGSTDWTADLEIILCFHTALNKLLPYAFTMTLGHREILSALLKKLFLDVAPEQEAKALIILDKLDKIGEKSVIEQLRVEFAPQGDAAEKLLEILIKSRTEDLSTLKNMFADDTSTLSVLSRFEMTLTTLQQLTRNCSGKIVCDLSIARGLGYYTGIVFETTVDDMQDFGSICSGGRYDHLCERFVNTPLPGVGASIGVDRLVALLSEKNFQLPESQASIFVAVASESAFPYAFAMAHSLREAGFRVEVPVKIQKIAAQFKYAHRLGFARVITVGEDEMQKQTFALKHMHTGVEERGLPLSSLLRSVAEGVPPSALPPKTLL